MRKQQGEINEDGHSLDKPAVAPRPEAVAFNTRKNAIALVRCNLRIEHVAGARGRQLRTRIRSAVRARLIHRVSRYVPAVGSAPRASSLRSMAVGFYFLSNRAKKLTKTESPGSTEGCGTKLSLRVFCLLPRAKRRQKRI